MIDSITEILVTKNLEHLLTIDLLLHGSNQLSYTENCKVFDAVQLFLIESKRFTAEEFY